jgi:hypothetical protein
VKKGRKATKSNGGKNQILKIHPPCTRPAPGAIIENCCGLLLFEYLTILWRLHPACTHLAPIDFERNRRGARVQIRCTRFAPAVMPARAGDFMPDDQAGIVPGADTLGRGLRITSNRCLQAATGISAITP